MAPTSVTFRTTALASDGIGSAPTLNPDTPVSCSFRVAPGPSAEAAALDAGGRPRVEDPERTYRYVVAQVRGFCRCHGRED